MKKDETKIIRLIQQKMLGTISEADAGELEAWLEERPEHRRLF